MKGRPDSTRVVDLFSEALEHPAAERDHFLDRACGADGNLRTRVERLLSGADDGFMESPAIVLERRVAEDAPGQRVGAYELVRPIASGGMGAVWLARRADESFEAVAALKLIKRGMDTDDILARFRAERQVLASLRHPNIAALLDGGATTDGRPYLVMEYVDGEPIDRFCDARHLSVRRRVELFRSVCAAVEHAHRGTVIHRDIKPANILVTADGTPKLLDFGIAKVVTPGAEATATRHRILTPGYASPEQVRGEAITTATDVYSLGVVLYELLTGRRPYKVATGSASALERAICETEPVRPSTAVGLAGEDREPRPAAERRATQRQLCGDLDTIVLMALRKEPERRYGSVGLLSEDLRRYLEGLPVAARSDTVRYRAGKFVRRNKVLVGSGVLVMASLIAGLAASTVMYIHARRAEAAEKTQRGIAEGETRESERLRGLAEWRAYSAQIAAALGSLKAGDVAGARQSLDQTAPEMRGWEYRYAAGQLDGSVDQVVAHGRNIYGLELSDVGVLATASEDGLVRLWDRRTLAWRETIPYFNGSVGGIAFSHDGSLLAIPNGPHGVMLWDVAGQREFQRLEGHKNSVRGAAFSPDGTRVVTGSVEGQAILWGRDGSGPFSQRTALLGHAKQVRGVAFSPDGSLVATASYDNTARLWDGRTGAEAGVLGGHTGGLYTAAFSPDSTRLVTASMDRTVRVWSVRGGGPALVLKGHTERVVNAIISPDGRLVASASWDRSVRLWDARTGESVATLLGHPSNVFGLAFTPDSRMLYTAGNDGTIRAWEVPRYWPTSENVDTRRVVGLVAASGRIVAALGPDDSRSASVQLWDMEQGRLGAVLLEAPKGTVCLSGSRDGGLLAAGLVDRTVALIDAAGGGPTRVLSGHRLQIRAVAVNADGSMVASGSNDQIVKLWDARSGKELAAWGGHDGPVRALQFTPEGLVSGGDDGLLLVRDLTGTELHRAKLGGPISAIALNADGDFLAVASGRDAAEITLYAWPEMASTAVLRGHTLDILGLAFSPDSARLASASLDHTVKLWDVHRGLEAATLYGHDYGAFSVAWDGDVLLSGAADARVRVWKPAQGTGRTPSRDGPQ